MALVCVLGKTADLRTLMENAISQQEAGKYAEAEQSLREALALAERNPGPNQADLLATLNNMAKFYWNRWDGARAKEIWDRALAIPDIKTNPKVHGEILYHSAHVRLWVGPVLEADELLRRALSVREQAFGRKSTEVAMTLSDMAAAARLTKRTAEARLLCKRALDILNVTLGQTSVFTLDTMNLLGSIQLDNRRYGEAEQEFLHVLQLTRGSPAPEQSATALSNLGVLYMQLGGLEKAGAYLEQAAETFASMGPVGRHMLAQALANIAEVRRLQRRYEDAEALYIRALAIPEADSVEHWRATTWMNLGMLYALQKRFADSEPMFQKALAMQYKLFGENSDVTRQTLANYAEMLRRAGRKKDAEKISARAGDIPATPFTVDIRVLERRK
jgi:tetratricopeptide (TPR) repeat protein